MFLTKLPTYQSTFYNTMDDLPNLAPIEDLYALAEELDEVDHAPPRWRNAPYQYDYQQWTLDD